MQSQLKNGRSLPRRDFFILCGVIFISLCIWGVINLKKPQTSYEFVSSDFQRTGHDWLRMNYSDKRRYCEGIAEMYQNTNFDATFFYNGLANTFTGLSTNLSDLLFEAARFLKTSAESHNEQMLLDTTLTSTQLTQMSTGYEWKRANEQEKREYCRAAATRYVDKAPSLDGDFFYAALEAVFNTSDAFILNSKISSIVSMSTAAGQN